MISKLYQFIKTLCTRHNTGLTEAPADYIAQLEAAKADPSSLWYEGNNPEPWPTRRTYTIRKL